MSVGNPKKFEDLSKLKKAIIPSENKGDVAKVYKNKNHEVKKALKFKTSNSKAKLA